MGMFDTFIYTCSYCGKEGNSQTKLGECLLDNLTIGCDFPMDGKILMKDSCEHCNSNNVVVVEDGIIMRFDKEEVAVFEEGTWGSCNKIVKSEESE